MLKRGDLEVKRWVADGATDRDAGRRYHQIDEGGPSVDTRSAMPAEPRTVCDTSNRDYLITDEEDARNSLLLAASPKLALACLRARAELLAHRAPHQGPQKAAEALRELDAALEAAGVEVEL